MIVNINSNQSQALKTSSFTYVILLFTFSLVNESKQMRAIYVC